MNAITVTDTLPSGWEYAAGQTTIVRADGSILSGASADDGNANGATTLTWSGADVFVNAGLAENQEITISFVAQTTGTSLNTGDFSRNEVLVASTRTLQGITQTFTASDFALVTFADSDLSITKTSDVVDVVYPGDTIRYTVVVENTGSTNLTDVSIFDPLPNGVAYVAGSGQLTGTCVSSTVNNVADNFEPADSYGGNDGSVNWATDWTENNDDGSPTGGTIEAEQDRLEFQGNTQCGGVHPAFRNGDWSNQHYYFFLL
ncbi:MAG: hypothetical protein R3F37_22260 [Candidatus Competibacteraceae bacterium]